MISKYLYALSLAMAFCKMFAGYSIGWDIIACVALLAAVNNIVKIVLLIMNIDKVIEGYKKAKAEDRGKDNEI